MFEKKIAVISLSYGQEYKHTVRYGRLNKIAYCEQHGYDFIEDESVVDMSRDLPWSKIPLIRKYLPLYEYILWVDADTYITNMDITVQSLIDLAEKQHKLIVYCKDPFIWVNTGVMLIKNNIFCQELLEECYNYTDQICWEQGAIDFMYRTNWRGCTEKILILDHSAGYNQYWHSWKEGDFLIHFPGCHEPGLKKNTLALMMDRFCPTRRDGETEEQYLTRIDSNRSDKLAEEYTLCRSHGKSLPIGMYETG